MNQQDRVETLLARYGITFSAEAGIRLDPPTPSALWSWYLTCLLMSARISAEQAVRAARAYLAEIGRTPEATVRSTWQQRVDVLNANGYARYDERTSSMLGETAAAMVDRYHGDLRRLRAEADGDRDGLHRLLTGFKGVGPVGADMFCREVQVVWDELYPFADDLALRVAEDVGLPSSVGRLAGLVSRREFPRLVAALVRASLAKDLEAVRAGRRPGPGDPRVVLERLTRDELYDLAKEVQVEGRSSMDKARLVEELAG